MRKKDQKACLYRAWMASKKNLFEILQNILLQADDHLGKRRMRVGFPVEYTEWEGDWWAEHGWKVSIGKGRYTIVTITASVEMDRRPRIPHVWLIITVTAPPSAPGRDPFEVWAGKSTEIWCDQFDYWKPHLLDTLRQNLELNRAVNLIVKGVDRGLGVKDWSPPEPYK